MKKILFSLFVLTSLFNLNCFATEAPSVDDNILTKDFNQVLETDDIDDPLRDGAYGIIGGDNVDPNGQISAVLEAQKITEHKTAMDNTLNLVKRTINYLLGFMGLVALIYLIYHGFLILTAGDDDAQYKKGLKSMKYAAIAIGGVGISWLFVSFIFWLIAKFIG